MSRRARLRLIAAGAVAACVLSCAGDCRRDHVVGTSAVVATAAHASVAGGGDRATLTLRRVHPGGEVVSFGVPLPVGATADVGQLVVRVGGRPVAHSARELEPHRDASGAHRGARAVLVQLDAAAVGAGDTEVELVWRGAAGSKPPKPSVTERAYGSDAVSAESAVVVRTARRKLVSRAGVTAIEEESPVSRTLFVGREPRVLALFPAGYVATSGLLGPLVTAERAHAPEARGLGFLSTAFGAFALSAMYDEPYALNPDAESVLDPVQDASAWLYDRCATFLIAYAHLGEPRFLRHALQSCSYYARQIDVAGPRAGFFRGKPEPDAKYSHARGLTAYYALTGDEAALSAVTAMARMWQADPLFVQPYAAGRLRGPDKLWTERLLATSLEGLVYGYRVTGDGALLELARRMVTTAHRHVTGSAADLATINPGAPFPPQGCFVHNAEQQAEGDATDPWCSPWMSAMLVVPLLEYQALTADPKVDDIFLALGRFLRDVGTTYAEDTPRADSFLSPRSCDDPAAGEKRRRLVPLYGAGLDAAGARRTFGEYGDAEHCADTTLLTAAALRALARQGTDRGRIGTFATERESLTQLHHELAACAERVFAEQTRPRRDPRRWTSAELAAGAKDPARFIDEQRIGFPRHVVSPARKLSWWFNGSMLQFQLLADAKVAVPSLTPGRVQPASCAR
jgi:hypothetical protein